MYVLTSGAFITRKEELFFLADVMTFSTARRTMNKYHELLEITFLRLTRKLGRKGVR
jgi:hypothetical protein